MKKLFFILFIGLISWEFMHAQTKPKIGLVLAGGGAKGLAHIGVIKVLEEAGFEVDIVGGTSMGSIVGGLYAIGYDAKTLEQQVGLLDWSKIMSQTPDSENQLLRVWEYNQRYQLRLPIINGKPGLPSGFNNGQKVYLMLTYLTEKYHQTRDFSKLPREFYCIACNYYTGKEVMLDTGFLPDAMRASSSIPSFFNPVRLNNEILIDGGWVNNFPVERMKERGADFIIGVDFPQVEYNPDADLSLIDVLVESGSYVNTLYNQVNRELCDVLIIPELGKISAADYNLADTIMKIGEATARKQLPRLKRLADSLGMVKQNIPSPIDFKAIHVSKVSVLGLDDYDKKLLENSLGSLNKDSVYPDEYIRELNNLYGSGDFDQVAYELKQNTDGSYLFETKVTQKKNSSSISASINYTSDFGAQLLLNYSRRNLFFQGYRISADVIASESPYLSVQYFSTLTHRFLPTGGLSYFSYHQPVYVEGKQFSRYQFQNFAAHFGLNNNLNENTYLGANLTYYNTTYSGDAFDLLDIGKSTTNYLNLKIYYKASSLRNSYFPKKGTEFTTSASLSSELTSSNFTNPYAFYNVTFMQAFHPLKHFSFLYRIRSGSTINRTLDGPNEFLLGGYGLQYPLNMLPFFGLQRQELPKDGLHAADVEIHFNLFGKHYLKAISNFGYTVDLYPNTTNPYQTNFILGYGGGYALDSPIGPMQIFVARTKDYPKWALFLYLGYWF